MSLLTRAEATRYEETSRHADVMTFIAGLQAKGDKRLGFYTLLTEHRGFARKPALEAVSRGGLHAYRYAARHPDRRPPGVP